MLLRHCSRMWQSIWCAMRYTSACGSPPICQREWSLALRLSAPEVSRPSHTRAACCCMRTMLEKDENHRFCWASAKSQGDQAGTLLLSLRCALRSEVRRGFRLFVRGVLSCSCSFGSLLLSAIVRDFSRRFRWLLFFMVTKLSTFEDERCAALRGCGPYRQAR